MLGRNTFCDTRRERVRALAHAHVNGRAGVAPCRLVLISHNLNQPLRRPEPPAG